MSLVGKLSFQMDGFARQHIFRVGVAGRAFKGSGGVIMAFFADHLSDNRAGRWPFAFNSGFMAIDAFGTDVLNMRLMRKTQGVDGSCCTKRSSRSQYYDG